MPAKILLLSLLMLSLQGCASWDMSKLDPSRLRDPRATDLDRRLSERAEPVHSPFGSAESMER